MSRSSFHADAFPALLRPLAGTYLPQIASMTTVIADPCPHHEAIQVQHHTFTPHTVPPTEGAATTTPLHRSVAHRHEMGTEIVVAAFLQRAIGILTRIALDLTPDHGLRPGDGSDHIHTRHDRGRRRRRDAGSALGRLSAAVVTIDGESLLQLRAVPLTVAEVDGEEAQVIRAIPATAAEVAVAVGAGEDTIEAGGKGRQSVI